MSHLSETIARPTDYDTNALSTSVWAAEFANSRWKLEQSDSDLENNMKSARVL
jgi:hypothetical protein